MNTMNKVATGLTVLAAVTVWACFQLPALKPAPVAVAPTAPPVACIPMPLVQNNAYSPTLVALTAAIRGQPFCAPTPEEKCRQVINNSVTFKDPSSVEYLMGDKRSTDARVYVTVRARNSFNGFTLTTFVCKMRDATHVSSFTQIRD